MEKENHIKGDMIKIAITGPESTGKTMLSEALSEKYDAALVPEYAREYLERLNRPYDIEDVLTIAVRQHQMISETALKSNKKILIADTELLVLSIWIEHKYKKEDPWVEQELRNQKFDLYLLCDIDLPWQFDPLREHPNLREYLFDKYRRKLNDLGFPYAVVNGLSDIRLQNTAKIIENHLCLNSSKTP